MDTHQKPPKQNADIVPFSAADARTMVRDSGMPSDPAPALKKLMTEILPKLAKASPHVRKKLEKEQAELSNVIAYGYEADTHVVLMESFGERYRGGMKEICKQLIHDFDCKTDAEKIMAETAAVAFGRYLDASRRLNNCLEFSNSTSPEKNTYLSMLSKERDRSHRQYLSTVSMIRQFKAPPVEMTIRAKTAFVSQNQQINVPPQENNEAK